MPISQIVTNSIANGVNVNFTAGSAAAPSVTTTGDTNTGIFFPAADTIAFAEGGAEVARFDSSGRLLVGTTSGGYGLTVGTGATDIRAQINGSTQYMLQLVNGANSGFWIGSPSADAMAFSRGDGVERMRIDGSGNLLVGTTSLFSGGEKLLVSSSFGDWTSVFKATNGTAGNNYGVLVDYTQAPNGTSNWFFRGSVSNGATIRCEFRSNGGLANYSANNVNLSDAREKTNVELAGSYLDKICAIPVKTFNYIDQDLEEDGGLTLGVIAQDVQAVAPELVMESNWAGKDEEPKMRLSIYQTDLQYALMKCIQEQQAIITDLKARIETLESK